MVKRFVPADIKKGDFYIDCAYHPVLCFESDPKNDNLCGMSLVDGSTPRSCSFRHCAPEKITKQRAEELADIWKERGERAVMIYMGWSEKDADEFIKNWRS